MENKDDYDDILAVRGIDEDARRGYAFEQIVRESLPWDFRPPVSARAKGEQLDAIFGWEGNQFVVEAKAKKKLIRVSDHDWEDFELKLRRRPHCIGLFLSAFPIHEDIVERAKELIGEGFTCLLIVGEDWDELHNRSICLDDFLRYRIARARTLREPKESNFKKCEEWLNDQEQLQSEIILEFRKSSATFLRRYKNPKHEDLYVRRQIDRKLFELTRQLSPKALSIVRKKKTRYDKDYDYRKQVPDQLCIIKDLSGSGKTTLGVQVAIETNDYFGITVSASQTSTT